MGYPRTLLVSNRLPVSITQASAGYQLTPSSGGLATALSEVHAQGQGRWIGWVGDTSRLSERSRQELAKEMTASRLRHVPLTASEVSLYYDGFSNAVLWPLFHYLLDKVRLDAVNEWRAYKAVNQRFADAIAEELKPDDVVWIHDYQLMLVPGMLRRKVPKARIGFFLHVPWPSSDVFRILPFREELLEGVLGADLIGFHTESYRHNFIHSAAKVLGLDLGVDTLSWDDRTVRIGVFPISIELETFERSSEAVTARVAQLRAGTAGKVTLLGVDRLDYTKGVPRRLLALDRLLEREPQLRGNVHFIQLAVPTREKVEAYAELRRNVNELVGRINSQYGSPTGSPVQLLYRSVEADELLALYRAADVMLVTPLRDGMNLVAKEYVAARTDEQGALVLSEFAGAASELDAALIVNPYDIAETAMAIRQAMLMPRSEQSVRMRKLRAAVKANPVHSWALSFMDELIHTEPAPSLIPTMSKPTEFEPALKRVREAPHRILMLDYDGTLVPLQALPDLAVPDEALLDLLRRLAIAPNTEVHVVSGRSRASLEPWLGHSPISLHIEHGFWSRDPAGRWTQVLEKPPEFLKQIHDVMQKHALRTPGTFVEQKAASVAFHYRRVDPHLAEARLRSLRAELTIALGPNAEILEGHKVVEVRVRGVHKGVVASRVIASAPPGSVVFAAGDDRTDEDLFDALPESAVSVHVGPGISGAKLRVSTPFELRRLLRGLLENAPTVSRSSAPPPPSA
jgi:trehalose 6-phosphate synthase/phosphatase